MPFVPYLSDADIGHDVLACGHFSGELGPQDVGKKSGADRFCIDSGIHE
jgi:hypothetical protein